jgi:hypothetical protein
VVEAATEGPVSAPKPDPQAKLIDAMSEDETLDALGPSWSELTPAQREAYGRGAIELDPLFAALEQVGGDDLLRDIEQDLGAILDRCEVKLLALEWTYRDSPEARARQRQRAAVTRYATENARRG